jgi:hypothetical protein
MKNFMSSQLEKSSTPFTLARWLHQDHYAHATWGKLASFIFFGLKVWSKQRHTHGGKELA